MKELERAAQDANAGLGKELLYFLRQSKKWWLAPILIVLSMALLARAHYVLYVLKRGNRFSAVVTWLSTLLVAGFWVWRWVWRA